MPGQIDIQTRVGCDANEVIMTLSGAAEPNGGDHYATVDFTGQSQNKYLVGLVSVELETSPGVWIGVTVQSFLFTSAGETYTLRARGHEILMNWPNIQFPYTVVAIYAPAWAALNGIINGTPVDEACCDYSSEPANILSYSFPIIQGFGGNPQAPQVVPRWSYFNANGCIYAAGSGQTPVYGTGTYRESWTEACNNSFTYTNIVSTSTVSGPAQHTVSWVTGIPYDWLNKEFTIVRVLTMSEVATWMSYDYALTTYVATNLTHSATATVTISKVAGSSNVILSVAAGATASCLGGSGDGSTPSAAFYPGYADYVPGFLQILVGDVIDVALPCTGAILRITPKLNIVGGGDGSGNRVFPGTRMVADAIIIKGNP